MKYSFYNDYSEGAHPEVLASLQKMNLSQEAGYGMDRFTKNAIELIRKEIVRPSAEIYFVSGGTQVNLVVLSAMLRPHESVIAVESGHINVHEAGSIEATGHKIHSVAGIDGKLTPKDIEAVCALHDSEHMVKPRAVYISNTTEVGTIYKKTELQALSKVCKELGLFLYLDGARLGSALASKYSDLDLSEIAGMVDVFYIGGTKNGALFGEAVVINHPELEKDFRYYLKQRGALLAKGRAIGLQFEALFSNGLYLELAQYANRMADLLTEGLQETGYRFLVPPVSNQIFPILPNRLIALLQEEYGFYVWSKGESDSVIRLVTSWATSEEAVNEFISALKAEK